MEERLARLERTTEELHTEIVNFRFEMKMAIMDAGAQSFVTRAWIVFSSMAVVWLLLLVK